MDYRARLSEVFGSHRWICAGDVLVPMAGLAAQIQDLGGGTLALGATRGTGTLPDGIACIDLRAGVQPSMMQGIRHAMHALQHLPEEVQARIDAWDPEGTARVVLPLFGDSAEVAKRRVFGYRLPAWTALEDKTTVDALWDAAGVRRAPSAIVAPADASAAAQRLDQGHGTVWVADNRTGWHGGAQFLRWVRTQEEADAACAYLGPVCHHLRVMPFLEGLPCSIHGIVLPTGTVALRPMEMIVLRTAGSSELHYAQAASFWDPPRADRDVMRDVARRVGEWLRGAVGYRGAFTVDGVLTRDGFLPTELNPRFGAALVKLATGLDFSLYLLNLCIVEGLDLRLDAADLEDTLIDHADGFRSGSGIAHLPHLPEPRTLYLQGPPWVEVEQDAPWDAKVSLGPGPWGGMAIVNLSPDRTPTGPSVAPRVADILNWLSRTLDLGLPVMQAAPSP